MIISKILAFVGVVEGGEWSRQAELGRRLANSCPGKAGL